MKFKKVVGLDIGTNSIGAALLEMPESILDYSKDGKILWCSSRIIPIEAEYLQKYEIGKKAETKAAARRNKRGSRRLKHRYKLRRTKLIQLFKILKWLPDDFPLDNPKRIKEIISEYGKFNFRISDYVPISDESYREFYKCFGYNENTIDEIIDEIKYRRNNKGKKRNEDIKLLPEDWVVYYLRKKGLSQKLTTEELIRVLYLFNQRRGFESSRKDLKENNTKVITYDEFKTKINIQIKGEDIDIIVKDEFKNESYETKFVSISKVKRIEEVISEESNKSKEIKKYKVYLEDNRIRPYIEERKEKPDWEGKEFTFLITQKIEKGKFKQNKPQLPKEDDWILCTVALDNKMGNKYPGEYFFDELVNAFKTNQSFKIRQYAVYRWRYKSELKAIWDKQCELNEELRKINSDKELLKNLAERFYPTQSKYNGPKLNEFLSKNLFHIVCNDIIYYQREHKSQKNLINECRYEKRKGKDGELYGLKCIPVSSPFYQEFRIWQNIHNIRIIRKEQEINGGKIIDIDETHFYINETIKEKLFELFDNKDKIREEEILNVINSNFENSSIEIFKDKEKNSHRVNLFRNREELEGNQTKYRYYKIFKKLSDDGKYDYILNSPELLFRLWQADYSHDSDNEEKTFKGLLSALGWRSETKKNERTWAHFKLNYLDAKSIAEAISKLEPFEKRYGAFSALAIRKMLIFMRCGKYWKHPQDIINDFQEKKSYTNSKKIEKEITRFINSLHDAMDVAEKIRLRLEEINYNKDRINEISDDEIPKQMLKSFLNRKNKDQVEFIKGLNTYQATYLLYGKYSEQEIIKANSPDEYGQIINKLLKPGSLRNPLVESVVKETCTLVKDIWKKFGRIDEIHIELARELKHNAKERENISKIQNENYLERKRIKTLLYELLNYESYEQPEIDLENESKINIVNKGFIIKPNPANPNDVEKFRLWKNQVKYDKDLYVLENEINKIIDDGKIPTEQQIKKYILWLTQNCRSPYTGNIIPLSKLFDGNEYEIEHIIPRSKFKNDSMNNLVIAESIVNKAKGNELAAKFIEKYNGSCEYQGTKIKLLTYNDYKNFVDDVFRNNRAKRKNLLATEVPDDFVERQINDIRYIGKKLNELLRPVLNNPNNIVFTIGSITSELKQNWGLNEVWKDVLKPRFERLEKILNKKLIFSDNENPNKYFYDLSINEKLDKTGLKRLDHRHHALDSIIIAVTTREHIRYLNTLSAADSDEEIKNYQNSLCKGKFRDFKLPWPTFVKDTKEAVLSCPISFKESKPIVTKPFNKYRKWEFKNGKLVKKFFIQNKNGNGKWLSVRRNLFKEPIGTIWLKEVKQVEIKRALEIQTRWNEIINDNEFKRKASYIYDQYARKYLNSIAEQLNLTTKNFHTKESEIKKWIKSISKKISINNKKYKTIYDLNGIDYEKIPIVEFVLYKTKRMSLNNNNYTQKLNIQKMKKDFPNFILEKELINKYPEIEAELLEEGYELDDNKKNSPVNRIFLEHILEYNNDPQKAFSGEGLDKLNKKAIETIGKPIKSITRLDGPVEEEDLFRGAVYETDKGSNVYFIMYENLETKEREYLEPTPSISAIKAIEKGIRINEIAPHREGYKRIILSPGELVYMPTIEQIEKIKKGESVDNLINLNESHSIIDRIYQVRKFTGKQCYFLKYNIADLILPYDSSKQVGEFGSQNISEYAIDDFENQYPIKSYCIKIKVNRLGIIEKIY